MALGAAPAVASAKTHEVHHHAGHLQRSGKAHKPSGKGHQAPATTPDLGSNVIIFNPSMSQATIQSQLNAISTQQVPNQFGTQRYSIFFEPGTYGSAADPLDFQVGFYTQVAGLGAQPGQVVINGAINVFNQSIDGSSDGTDNFWRSLSNLTLNVDLPQAAPAYAPDPADPYGDGCDNTTDMWAVSQAAPVRRVIVNGPFTLQDYCSPTGYVSGGFMADDEFNGSNVGNDGQQQFFVRNSNIDMWSNGVWNQVFMGDNGAPATSFGAGSSQYTNVAATPESQEEPFLYTDSGGNMQVFVPSLRRNSVGPSYSSGSEAGSSIPISRFFIASPSTSVSQINAALARGLNLILTPGVYDLPQTIEVDRADTVILGLGFATLIPTNGNVAMSTGNVPGIKLSGLIFDAGAKNSPVLLQLGNSQPQNRYGQDSHDGSPVSGNPNDPTLAQDVFFRIGGAEVGAATDSLVVNDSDAILDDVWAWRADHGAGAAWTQNTADTGVVVNGNNVFADGLAVEHYQKNEVIWNGQGGEDVFFQNEMPYDPPSQSAWMSSLTSAGYPAFVVSPNVTSFTGYGMGSYSFFNQGVPIYSTDAFSVPAVPGVQMHDLLTVFLNAQTGSGGISSVVDGVGGSSTAANPSTPVDVTSFP
jgi:hypothetical protein